MFLGSSKKKSWSRVFIQTKQDKKGIFHLLVIWFLKTMHGSLPAGEVLGYLSSYTQNFLSHIACRQQSQSLNLGCSGFSSGYLLLTCRWLLPIYSIFSVSVWFLELRVFSAPCFFKKKKKTQQDNIHWRWTELDEHSAETGEVCIFWHHFPPSSWMETLTGLARDFIKGAPVFWRCFLLLIRSPGDALPTK